MVYRGSIAYRRRLRDRLACDGPGRHRAKRRSCQHIQSFKNPPIDKTGRKGTSASKGRRKSEARERGESAQENGDGGRRRFVWVIASLFRGFAIDFWAAVIGCVAAVSFVR